jgi:hypothetical protein
MGSRGSSWRRAGVAASAAFALAACSVGIDCTAVGCRGEVAVNLAEVAAGRSAVPATARLCVAGACGSSPVRAGARGEKALLRMDAPSFDKDEKSPTVPVTLRVMRGAEVLVDTATNAVLTPWAPNGEDCEPVCFGGSLTLHDGKLVAAPG